MNKDEYKAHTIIVCRCVVALGATKKIAEELAKSHGYKDCIVVPTTKRHLELFVNGKSE